MVVFSILNATNDLTNMGNAQLLHKSGFKEIWYILNDFWYLLTPNDVWI